MSSDENKRKNRLAFLGTLASGLAHEIKNPLSAMSVNLQMLREDLEQSDQHRDRRFLKRVAVLESEVARLERILDGFLRYARGYSLHLLKDSVNTLIREVAEFWASKAKEEGIEVELVLESDLPDVAFDSTYLKQALLNLLNNALEAIVQRADRSKSEEQIVLVSRRVEQAVEILVIDSGPGIRADHVEHIFEPYFSTKRGGSGLGLSAARRIVEDHGGSLNFQSEEGRGSCFTIRLPVGIQGEKSTPTDDAEKVAP